MLSVEGLGKVARLGGVDREIHVNLNPMSMVALGITASDILRVLNKFSKMLLVDAAILRCHSGNTHIRRGSNACPNFHTGYSPF